MIAINNYEYLQSLPLDLFEETLIELFDIDELCKADKTNTYLMNWIKSDIDEEFRKCELLNYCEKMDEKNQLLAENQYLKETNDYLIKELFELIKNSITREKALVKLKEDVKRKINEYDPNQITLDEYLYRQGDLNC